MMPTDVRESWRCPLWQEDLPPPSVVHAALPSKVPCLLKLLESTMAAVDLRDLHDILSQRGYPYMALRKCCTGPCKCHEGTMWNLRVMSGVVTPNVLIITNQGSFFLYQWRRHRRPATGTASINMLGIPYFSPGNEQPFKQVTKIATVWQKIK